MIQFQEIEPNEAPWELLLLAQPSSENIQAALKQLDFGQKKYVCVYNTQTYFQLNFDQLV